MSVGEKRKLCSKVFTVHVGMYGERETHAVDVGGVDTVGTVLEKSAEVLRVDKRYLTLLHDGNPLDDLTQGVTGTTLCEGSEVEARMKEPTVVRLLSDNVEEEAEAAVSASPDGILYLDVCGVQGALELPQLPAGMRHLILIDTDPEQTHITSIYDNFLSECTSLEALDLSPLLGVTSIGNYFLCDCTSLQSLDLSPLSGATSVGYNFLSRCTSLEALDLSPLSSITSISDCFLSDCTLLETLDLSPLSSATSVSSGFLSYCRSLQTLDLSPLSGVTSIGKGFLYNCTSLQSLDLSPLLLVISIGSGFLCNCTSLQSLDLSPLSRVTSINYGFLSRCPALEARVDLSPVASVVKVLNNELFLGWKRRRAAVGSVGRS